MGEPMEQYGNKSNFNIEGVLATNINNSDYLKRLFLLTTWTEVIDEIYNEVEHVEPWMGGNARGPSTAFCLMFKLCQLKLTTQQIRNTLDHADSPFIRAIGFLYLRYVADPKTLYGWFEEYLTDEEEIQPSPDGRSYTIGTYVRDLMLEQYYFDTLFPRIPEVARRDILAQLEYRGLPTKGSGATGTTKQPDSGVRRPPSVKASLSVNLGQRAPHRSGQREEGRGIDPTLKFAGEGGRAADREKARSGSRDLDGTRSGSPSRGEYRPRERDSRDRERERDYERKPRERSRERDHETRRDYERDSRRDYDERRRDDRHRR